MDHPRTLFVYFRSFQAILQNKSCILRGIQTQIFGVQGEHTDLLTTTTAQGLNSYLQKWLGSAFHLYLEGESQYREEGHTFLVNVNLDLWARKEKTVTKMINVVCKKTTATTTT